MTPRAAGVILVVLDSLRADAVDPSPDGPTPNLALLAAGGLTFTRAVAPAAWTLPSHVTMVTGTYPSEHRIQARSSATIAMAEARVAIAELTKSDRFLPAWLRSHGVRTFLGSANVWLSPASGFSQPFDEVEYVPFPPRGDRKSSTAAVAPRPGEPPRLPPGARRRIPRPIKHAGRFAIESMQRFRTAVHQAGPLGRWAMAREDKGGERVVAALERSLRAGMPFFGMLNLIETHGPHLAPRGYGPPDRSAIAATVLRPGQTWTRRMHEHNWSYKRLPDRVIARQRKAYAAEVRYADHCIGSILQALREQGLGDEVTIIVTGDHGEAFGEDGLVGHGLSLGESVLNVPLLVKGPGVPQGTVDEPVSLASFAATVAESLVAEAHPFPTPSFFDDAGRGRARAELEAPWDHFHPPGLRSREAPPGMQRPAAAFYDGTLKLIDGSFWGEALYDLSADPGEDTNLIRHRDVPEGIARMRSEWRERVGLP